MLVTRGPGPGPCAFLSLCHWQCGDTVAAGASHGGLPCQCRTGALPVPHWGCCGSGTAALRRPNLTLSRVAAGRPRSRTRKSRVDRGFVLGEPRLRIGCESEYAILLPCLEFTLSSIFTLKIEQAYVSNLPLQHLRLTSIDIEVTSLLQ